MAKKKKASKKTSKNISGRITRKVTKKSAKKTSRRNTRVLKKQKDDIARANRIMTVEAQLADSSAPFPDVLPVLPLREVVLYPDMVLPLVISEERDIKLVEKVSDSNRFMVTTPVVSVDNKGKKQDQLHPNGCAAVILKMLRFPDHSVRVLVQGIKRVAIKKFNQKDPFFVANIEVRDDVDQPSLRLDALHRNVRGQFEKLTEMLPQIPEEVKIASININQPGAFADLVASNINLSMEERCQVLDSVDVTTRLNLVSLMLARELQIVELDTKIQEDVKEKIGKGQRDYYLREQIKAIRHELGDDNDSKIEADEIAEKLEQAGLPEEAMKEATRELKRMRRMQSGGPEYTVARTYLDWMCELPWQVESDDCLDIRKARKVLEEDHYNLRKVKDRIIEFLSVRKIHPGGRSPIICLAGPPGVGKTSLGKSIARAMGRKFVRISLGGVRDEAEIRGHRRTYIGSMPGRIMQGLRKAGTRNPVFMMDEIDKLQSDFRGDPASALLEVLDPEQNHSFSDHYVDAAFDLSKVIFITTANQIDTIPHALRDRMEVLTIAGYSEEEKLHIAQRHLIPRVLKDHGIEKVKFNVTALRKIIRGYTREAGVRNLERTLATVTRKIAVQIAGGKRGPFTVAEKSLPKHLGPAHFRTETILRTNTPGVATGLVWTSVGGDILFIEATRMAGKKRLQLTGSLGDVIKESAHAALSWIRTHALELGIHENFFDDSDIHIHFPEGATPKDGPSAGIALVASLISLLTKRKIAPRLAMTGEITLRGTVLPVGGIKEKMLGARRCGIKDIILPADNMKDLEELPAEIKKDLKFHPIKEIADMLPIAFGNGKRRR